MTKLLTTEVNGKTGNKTKKNDTDIKFSNQ